MLLERAHADKKCLCERAWIRVDITGRLKEKGRNLYRCLPFNAAIAAALLGVASRYRDLLPTYSDAAEAAAAEAAFLCVAFLCVDFLWVAL